MRKPIPKNFFVDWKDEDMIKWDRFIYNMKRNQRNLFGELNSHDDVISFYQENFNISLSIEDLKERPYIVHIALELSKRVLIFLPSNEDLKKLIFYDKDFLIRISNTFGSRIEIILIDSNYLEQSLRNINIRVYPIYQSEFLPFESMLNQYKSYYQSSEINKELRELTVVDYDKTIEKVKNLIIRERISAPLNKGLVYLFIRDYDEQKMREIVIPDSVRFLSLDHFNSGHINEGLIDLEVGYSFNSDVYQLPSSVKSLEKGMTGNFYSESLECLKIYGPETPEKRMASNIKVLIAVSAFNDFSIFHNLEILVCYNLPAEVELPPKLIAIFTSYNSRFKFPDGLKYLHISKDDEGDITVPEGLQYLHVNKTSTNLPKSLIYLYSNKSDLEVDLRTLPNLIYLKVNPEANIKNMRNNIMFEYTTK